MNKEQLKESIKSTELTIEAFMVKINQYKGYIDNVMKRKANYQKQLNALDKEVTQK